MAVVTALKFLERMEREESLRTQLYVSQPADLSKMTEFARGKGFIFSEPDFVEAFSQYEERFPTGTIAPLKEYVDEYKMLPSGDAE